MAFDGFVVRALQQELNSKLQNARLDKIYQPEPDELLLLLHSASGVYRLTLSANASIPRITLSEDAKENPMVAPMFCMLLRKHFTSAHLLRITQPSLERMLTFEFETRNELGDKVVKSIIVEIMGRHSNIIVTDEFGRVLDSIKRIDFSVSSKRQILPGLPYEMPPAQDKKDPTQLSLAGLLEALADVSETEPLDKAILSRFQGISPLVAREIVFLSFARTDVLCKDVPYTKRLDVATNIQKLLAQPFSPCYLVQAETGKLMEFSAIPITQYENSAILHSHDSMAELIAGFYAARTKKERMTRRSSDLTRLVSSQIERIAKKLTLQTAELSDTKNRETWRRYGELITANLYAIQKGDEHARVTDYFDETMPQITIPLDASLSPGENAQKYFKKYNKAKTAEAELLHQIALAREELTYLESVEEALSRAETLLELSQIGDELAGSGYIRRPKTAKKKEAPAEPVKLLTSDGFTLFAGKNNKQNDLLTTRLAHGRDLWFHTKNIPGSHVVLRFEPERPFTEEAIFEAASLAAFLSKASLSENVPVDYTEIKFVKKPTGAKPGFVIYTTNQTVYVTPKSIDSYKKYE